MFSNLNQMIDQWLAFEQKSQTATSEPWTFSTTRKTPKINLYEADDKVVLTAELPGLQKAEIDLKVQGNSLIISSTPAENEEKPETYIYRERGLTAFNREIKFGFDIDAEQVEAQFENGILTVTLLPVAAEQPKTIALS